MTELDPSASLTMATRRQKSKMLGVVLAIAGLIGAAIAFYFLYSAPREKRKKIQLKTETAWSWYSQLAVCLGGPGTPPGDPNAIYQRALTAFEDDPQFIQRAKECGHAEDILDGLRDVEKVGPNATTRAVLTPLMEDTRQLQAAVTEFVAMAIEGPTKGEDTGRLYGALWKVAIGFEKLHELVGLPSPLKPPASRTDAPGVPTQMPTTGGPPAPPAPTALDFFRPATTHGGLAAAPGAPAQGGAFAVTWNDGKAGAIVLPSGGLAIEKLDVTPPIGPFRVVREAGKTARIELAYRGRAILGEAGGALLVGVKDDVGGLTLRRGGASTPISPNGEWMAVGGTGARVMALYRAPSADKGKDRIEVRVSDDGGARFGGVLATKMELVPTDVRSPGCIAGAHLWFGAYEIGYHSADSGKTFRRMTVHQPKGGGYLAQILCAPDGRAAFVFHPRNDRKAGLWVAGCVGAECNSTTEPEPMTMRHTSGSAVVFAEGSVLAVWAEGRRLRARRAPSAKNLTYWDGSQPLAGPDDFPAGARLLAVSPREGGALVAWVGAGDAIHTVATRDGGLSWGPP